MFKKKELHILVIGLDNAGKSTILNQLRPESQQISEIEPTQGITETTIQFNKINLKFRDMGGASNFRPMWEQYADKLNGMIFVVDSSDTVRFTTAADELFALLQIPSVASVAFPLLVFANKNDIEGSAPPEVIASELGITEITNRPTLVKSVCARFPNDLRDGIEWLIAQQK